MDPSWVMKVTLGHLGSLGTAPAGCTQSSYHWAFKQGKGKFLSKWLLKWKTMGK